MKLENRKAYHIRKTRSKALRKMRIVKDQHNYWYYPYFGMYRKGKIHCSCPLCRAKTRYEGYKHSDQKKIDMLNYKDEEDR